MIWYFLWTTFLLLIGLQCRAEKQTRVKIFSLLILHRILRKLNQTGDKWSALPDINDWFRTPDNKHWLSTYMIFGKLQPQNYYKFFSWLAMSKIMFFLDTDFVHSKSSNDTNKITLLLLLIYYEIF